MKDFQFHVGNDKHAIYAINWCNNPASELTFSNLKRENSLVELAIEIQNDYYKYER